MPTIQESIDKARKVSEILKLVLKYYPKAEITFSTSKDINNKLISEVEIRIKQ